MAIVEAYGGWDNISAFSNCATRLRYDVKDASKVDKEKLKKAGVIAVQVISSTHVQAVVGTQAETLNNLVKAAKEIMAENKSMPSPRLEGQ